MNRLAEKIQAARLKAKLTEKELAKKSGLSVGYIIQIESGKKIIKEEFADKILKALGEKPEQMEYVEPTAAKEPIKKQVKQAVSHVTVKPNDQWADALAGVIKKYPVHDCQSGKVVEYRELPILGKKIIGHHPDKIAFVRASDNQMEALRIKRNDVVTLVQTTEIQNGQIYVLEKGNQKIIRKIRKESGGRITLLKGKDNESLEIVDVKKIKVIGKCLQVEFKL